MEQNMAKEKEKVVRHATMTKADKLGLAMAKIRGVPKQAAARLDAEQNYQSWRKEGFKGAWWQHYFSKNEKD